MLHARFWRAVAATFVATLAAFLLAGRSDATSIRLPLKDLSARSPLVVRGRVERIDSAWTATHEIESTVYVRLSDAPRGHLSAGALIPVRVRGGRVDGLTMVSEEEATFETGQEVYLFLDGLHGGAYGVTAGRQGKFDVVGEWAVNRASQSDLRIADLLTGVREDRWPSESEGGLLGPSPVGVQAEGTPSPTQLGSGAGTPSGASADSYVYNNAKWFGPNAMEEKFLINVNTGDAGGANGSADAFRNAIIAAANTWNNAGAAFSFKYGGTTTATSWSNDGNNVVYWQDLGNSPTLAEAQWWKYDSGQITDVDLRFNDYYTWDATGKPAGSEPDLQSIATHELGHWLSLAHDNDGGCPNSGPVMCASYVLGTLKRNLGANDIAGIRSIYGQASIVPTVTPTRTPVPTLSPGQIKKRVYLPMLIWRR